MMCILVTGGAGFIGSSFVRQQISDQSVRIVNLDKLTYAGHLESLADVEDDANYVFCRGDIGDGEQVAALLVEHQPDAVVNFAAESHVDRSIDGPAQFVATNVQGTVKLLTAVQEYFQHLNAGRRARFRFLHVSTDEVYGSLGPTGKFTETTPYAPNSPYAASKASSDHFVRAWHQTFGLPTLITNCSNNYGPYQYPEKLIPLMILNALEGKPLPVYGDGSNVRDWLYVEDHCRALRLVLKQGRPGETYNIGGNCERTNLQIVEAISDRVDDIQGKARSRSSRRLITFVADRPGHDQRYAIDTAKIESELGWRAKETFETGLDRTVCWYLENANWIQAVTEGKYNRERLGVGR